MTEGVEGGTWTGLTKQGKLAFITNIRQPTGVTFPDKKGRGSLISNFLTNATPARIHMNDLEEVKNSYRPFNLIIGNILDDFYYINSVDNKKAQKLDPGKDDYVTV